MVRAPVRWCRSLAAAALAVTVPLALAGLAACSTIFGFDELRERASDASDAAMMPDCGAPLGTTDNCAACGHSCLGAACQNGACAPIPLAGGLTNPEGIAVDGTSVYVALNFDDKILKIDKNGAGSTPITGQSAGGFPRSVATDGTRVFWTASNGVHACAVTGCAGSDPTSFPSDSAVNVILAGDRIIWSEPNNAAVRSADKRDGRDARTLANDVLAAAFASDGTYLYATDELHSAVLRAPLDGGAAKTMTQSAAKPFGIAVTSTAVYFGQSPGAIVTIPIGGGPQRSFGAPTISAAGLTTDGQFLYWADQGDLDSSGLRKNDGCIRSCPLATCETAPPIDLACGQAGAVSIAVDDRAVYWTTFGVTDPTGAKFMEHAGTVMKVAKPPR